MRPNIVSHFIGYWTLYQWHCYIDGQEHQNPFGSDVQGSLLYTASGYMSAVLKKNKRIYFESDSLIKGSIEEKTDAVESYINYMGKFIIENNSVIHQVEHSLFPNWEGAELIRAYRFYKNYKELELTVPPTKTKNNKTVTNVLIWNKVN